MCKVWHLLESIECKLQFSRLSRVRDGALPKVTGDINCPLNQASQKEPKQPIILKKVLIGQIAT